MAMLKEYVITCAVANTAYNVLSGTTAAPTTPYTAADKGWEATVQNQTAGTVAKVGGADVVSLGGLLLIDIGGTQTYRGNTPSGIQVGEMWVSSNTNNGVVLVQLKKYI